jgi:large subunit ribosomal protein L25
MAEAINMTAVTRDRVGKGVARLVRREGKIPAVIYGNKEDTVSISVDGKELNKLINKPGFFTHVFSIDVAGDTHRVLARDLQIDPVTDQPLHVDFLRFSEGTKVVIEIPVKFIQEEASPGLKRGGVLNIVRRELELRCSPLNIPQEIEIDLTGFEIGDSIHISALDLPDGAEPITDRDFTIATVAAPTIMAADEEAEEVEEGADPGEDGENAEVSESDSED